MTLWTRISAIPAPVLSPAQRLFGRWWPSRRLGFDPLAQVCINDRYRPVTIANWKLTPWMRHAVLAGRVERPLSFTSARLCIVIPYRDREAHLRELMPALTAVLARQRIQYRILVVEQANAELFNRGWLLNVGMHHAAERCDYYCLHDVDAVPVEANYACPSQPLRLVSAIDRPDGATAREPHYFSGAVSVRKEQAFACNGFSNEYRGWGKEDDDFFFRLLLAGCVCYADAAGRYLDLPNPKAVAGVPAVRKHHTRLNRKRRSLLVRGLVAPLSNGLSTLNYKIVGSSNAADYERLSVTW